MKQVITFIRPLIAIALLATVFSACKDDTVEPTTATIRGVVTIENTDLWATWQDSGEVQLDIFPEFSLNPPAGWGEVPDDILGPGVPGGTFPIGAPWNSQMPIIATYQPGATQYSYELKVDPGTYSALALGFRNDRITEADKKTATLGVYWNNPDSVSHGIVLKVDVGGGNIVTIFNYPPPTPITVKAGDDIELNFKADFGFVEDWF